MIVSGMHFFRDMLKLLIKAVSYTHLDVYKRQEHNSVSKKYLWALPIPTTFENVDQIFIIARLNY